MNKKVVGGILTGVALAAGVVFSIYDYKTTMYKCPHCHVLHKPNVWEWALSPHKLNERKVMCPRCGAKDWHERFVIAHEEDFN